LVVWEGKLEAIYWKLGQQRRALGAFAAIKHARQQASFALLEVLEERAADQGRARYNQN